MLYLQKNRLIFDNTMMRRVAYWNVQREMHLVEASYRKRCEDYLGVPLIQAVDYVIIG